jgi:hypothetical protein
MLLILYCSGASTGFLISPTSDPCTFDSVNTLLPSRFDRLQKLYIFSYIRLLVGTIALYFSRMGQASCSCILQEDDNYCIHIIFFFFLRNRFIKCFLLASIVHIILFDPKVQAAVVYNNVVQELGKSKLCTRCK